MSRGYAISSLGKVQEGVYWTIHGLLNPSLLRAVLPPPREGIVRCLIHFAIFFPVRFQVALYAHTVKTLK
jgi:hypothetical protein